MEKADFRSYRMLVREVQQLREQLLVLEASIYSPKGQRFTSTPKATASSNATMDAAVDRHLRLDRLYREKLASKEAEQLAIEQAIQSLENPAERVVMRELYLNGKSWPAVIREMQKLGYSERTAYRLHGLALLRLKEVKV